MNGTTTFEICKVVNKTTELYLDEEGILRTTFLEGAEIDLEEAKENLRSVRKLSGGNKILNLVDGRAYFTMTKRARDFAAGKESNEFNIACAIVSNSLTNRLLINFFITFHKPPAPVKMFSSEEEALKWLRKFKHQISKT